MFDTIINFVERSVGPLLFAAGIAALLGLLNSQTNFLNAVKETYTSDAVLSQEYVEKDYKETVTNDEIIGTLLAGPSVEMKIVNKQGWRTITVTPQSDGSLHIVTVEKFGATNKEVYNKTIFNLQGFDRTWIQTGEYSQDFKYGSSGELESITYTKTS